MEFPINQQIAPDGVDRFAFTVGHDRDGVRVFVYQLDLAVRHDNAKNPPRSDAFSSHCRAHRPWTVFTWTLHRRRGCGQEVIDSLREAAQLEGVRSPQLDRALTAVENN